MKSDNYKLLLFFFAITYISRVSVANPDVNANNTESINSEDYPNDSYYYYDQYNNGEEVTFDQAKLQNQQISESNTISSTNSINNSNIIEQLEVVKQIETNVNELNVEDDEQTNRADSSKKNNIQDNSIEEETATSEILGSSDDTADVSDVFIINADSDHQDYPLDTENSDGLLNKLASKSTTPAIVQSSLKTQTVSQTSSSRNYITFLLIFVFIVIASIGLSIVTVLFVKRRSLLLKSKCQIVTGKGPQSYITVGQTDY